MEQLTAIYLHERHRFTNAKGDIIMHQVEQLQRALASRICVLGGSPGTGKTYAAAKLIASIIDNDGTSSIAVATPTGKAAVRITGSLQQAGIAAAVL